MSGEGKEALTTMAISNGRVVRLIAKLGTPILLCAFSWSCCHSVSNSTQNVSQQETSSPNQTARVRPHDPQSPSISKTAAGRLWRRFIEDGRYRLASGDDFRFPQWALERQLLPQTDDIEVPFIPTSIGFVAIVVDTTRDDPERFGLLIITADDNAKNDADGKDDIHWVLRQKDLSHTAIGVSSSRVYLQEFREDGTYTSCDIVWDDQKREYACENGR